MSWSEIDYTGKYNYLPSWIGIALTIVGIIGSMVSISYILLSMFFPMGGNVEAVGLFFASFVLLYIGEFMEMTGFLLDTSKLEELREEHQSRER